MQDEEFFASPLRFRPAGKHFYSDGAVRLGLSGRFGSSKSQEVLREIVVISTTCPDAFYYSCFAAV